MVQLSHDFINALLPSGDDSSEEGDNNSSKEDDSNGKNASEEG